MSNDLRHALEMTRKLNLEESQRSLSANNLKNNSESEDITQLIDLTTNSPKASSLPPKIPTLNNTVSGDTFQVPASTGLSQSDRFVLSLVPRLSMTARRRRSERLRKQREAAAKASSGSEPESSSDEVEDPFGFVCVICDV